MRGRPSGARDCPARRRRKETRESGPRRFADRRRAVAFYRVLFGVEPTKDVEDHVRFELETPPLVIVQHDVRRKLKETYGFLALQRVMKQGDNVLSFFSPQQSPR